MTKKELRQKAREIRDSIDTDSVILLSGIIQDKVCNHPWFERSKTVFVYVSAGNEVRTNDIIEKAIRTGKRVCVPRVIPRVKMEAVPISNPENDLQTGFFGILEPKPHLRPVSEKETDLVIVPGLVFDLNGFRIGYGGGYYDKYLAQLPDTCKTIGIAFEFQVVDELPAEAHDRNVMAVITEKRVIMPGTQGI
ncbi:MAG: 5-formyltetrahydrofolate cyclo-ligase [Clostridiaceae bacterium]|nr:5-formyltetrahydrofolate cyclo-ligase [Clostridiaceae bacterium]